MPNSALARTPAPSSRPDSSVRSSNTERVAHWLMTFGEVCGREITPELAGIWAETLAHLDPEVLERACQRVLRTSRFFPTPADILGQIEQADELALQAEAEGAWQQVLEYVRHWVVPDLPGGVARRAPALPPAIVAAVRVAGGLVRIESCSQDELTWVRKLFLETYMRGQKADELAALSSTAEGRKLLAEVAAVAQEKAFAPRALPKLKEQSKPSLTPQASAGEDQHAHCKDPGHDSGPTRSAWFAAGDGSGHHPGHRQDRRGHEHEEPLPARRPGDLVVSHLEEKVEAHQEREEAQRAEHETELSDAVAVHLFFFDSGLEDAT